MEEARRVTRQQTSKPVLKYSNSNGNLSTQINSNYGNGHLATHIHSSYGNGHVPYPHQNGSTGYGTENGLTTNGVSPHGATNHSSVTHQGPLTAFSSITAAAAMSNGHTPMANNQSEYSNGTNGHAHVVINQSQHSNGTNGNAPIPTNQSQHSTQRSPQAIPLFSSNDIKSMKQQIQNNGMSGNGLSSYISASNVNKNSQNEGQDSHYPPPPQHPQQSQHLHLKQSPLYQPLTGMTSMFNAANYMDEINYNPYASPLSAKDLGVEDRTPMQPSLVPRKSPLRAMAVNKMSSPLLRSSSSGSLSSNGTYSSNNSGSQANSVTQGVSKHVVQVNSFMRPRSEMKIVQRKEENNENQPTDVNSTVDESVKIINPANVGANVSKRQSVSSRNVSRHSTMPTRYTTVPNLAPRPVQLNANRSHDNNVLTTTHQKPAEKHVEKHTEKQTEKNTPIVNNAADLYVRPTVIKHTENPHSTHPGLSKVSSLSSLSTSSMKSEANSAHIKYVSLTSNGHLGGTKTSPTVRNSKPHSQSNQSANPRSSIPKPGSAAGAALDQPTPPSPPTSASGGNYLVRIFSTRARNMNYTPTKPYNEVSDSSATSTTSSNSQADSQSVETHEPSRGTNDPFGLTTQKYVPQSRPGSSRPGSGHPTGGNSHTGAGSRPDSATLFYHKESKNDRVMARTDVVRRPPPEQVKRLSMQSKAKIPPTSSRVTSKVLTPRSGVRAKTSNSRLITSRVARNKAVASSSSTKTKSRSSDSSHDEDEWEDEMEGENNTRRLSQDLDHDVDRRSSDEDFTDDEAIDDIDDDYESGSDDESLDSAAQHAGTTRIRSATRRMLGLTSPQAKSKSRPGTARSRSRLSTYSCISSDSDLQPALLTSIFPHVPPTVNFVLDGEKVEQLPWEIRKFFKWRMSPITPNVVKNAINRSHFRPSKRNNDWIGYWGKHMKAQAFKAIKDYQKVNHFPGSFQIGRKDRLWRNLSRLQAHYGKKEFAFFPQTFVLPSDFKQLKRVWEEGGNKQKWIIKPPASARGIGIRVISKWAQVPKRRPVIVQRYLGRPYLINESKFDLRLYVYVTSYDPLRIYLYDDGLVRFASCKYSYSMKNINNKYMHLTNYSINKKNTDYQSNTDENACQGHKWGMKALWEYMRKRNIDTNRIWENIKDLVIKTIISSEACVASQVKANCARKQVCHELFGFDVMLDEDYKPWIIEVNISPSLHSNSQLDINIKGGMIKDLLNLAGYQIPAPNSEANTSHVDLPADICMDKRLHPTQISSDERSKHAYYCQKAADEHVQTTILDTLTPDDVRMLTETLDEDSRKGNMLRIFPTTTTNKYMRFMEAPRYYNLLLDYWLRRYARMESRGLTLLENLCQKKIHLHNPTDLPNHQWCPPNSTARPESRVIHSTGSSSKLMCGSAVLPRLHKKPSTALSSSCSLSSLESRQQAASANHRATSNHMAQSTTS